MLTYAFKDFYCLPAFHVGYVVILIEGITHIFSLFNMNMGLFL